MKPFILSVVFLFIASVSSANSAGSTSYEPVAAVESGGSAGSTSYDSEGGRGVVGRSRDRRMRRQGRRANRQDNRQARRSSRQQAVGWNYTSHASATASHGSAGSTSYAPASQGSAGSTSYATSTYCVE